VRRVANAVVQTGVYLVVGVYFLGIASALAFLTWGVAVIAVRTPVLLLVILLAYIVGRIAFMVGRRLKR
jgi:hypothetical protein